MVVAVEPSAVGLPMLIDERAVFAVAVERAAEHPAQVASVVRTVEQVVIPVKLSGNPVEPLAVASSGEVVALA